MLVYRFLQDKCRRILEDKCRRFLQDKCRRFLQDICRITTCSKFLVLSIAVPNFIFWHVICKKKKKIRNCSFSAFWWFIWRKDTGEIFSLKNNNTHTPNIGYCKVLPIVRTAKSCENICKLWTKLVKFIRDWIKAVSDCCCVNYLLRLLLCKESLFVTYHLLNAFVI